MRRGFTLIEIMIVVAVIALLAALGIPNLLRARVNAGEANAQAILRTISTACESYAITNTGNYPPDMATLTGSTPPYLNDNYTASARQGYTFACILNSSGYTCTANPQAAMQGARTYSITTGGILRP